MMKKKIGFSLTEIVVVVSLIGILAAVSVPGILTFYRNHNLKSSVELLRASFAQGFSTARSQNKTIIISGEQADDFFVYDGEPVSLSGASMITEDFLLTFVPPFGDIEASSSDEIGLVNNQKQVEFKVYKTSGLITLQANETE